MCTHSIDFRQALNDAEHELRVAVRVIGEADTQPVDHHIEHGLREQRFRQVSQVVLYQTCVCRDGQA